MLTGDAKIVPNKRCGGNAAEAYNYLGVNEPDLLCKPGVAGILLLVTGVTVSRRAALYDVCYVYLTAVKVYHPEHIVKQLPRRPHKGYALQILLLTRAFADEHDLGTVVADTEHQIRPCFSELAAHAAQTIGVQLLHISTAHQLSSEYFASSSRISRLLLSGYSIT